MSVVPKHKSRSRLGLYSVDQTPLIGVGWRLSGRLIPNPDRDLGWPGCPRDVRPGSGRPRPRCLRCPCPSAGGAVRRCLRNRTTPGHGGTTVPRVWSSVGGSSG